MLYLVFFLFLDGRYLISQGANVGVVNSEGETPLDIAEEEAMVELLQNEINRQGAACPTPTTHDPHPLTPNVHGRRAHLQNILQDRIQAVAAAVVAALLGRKAYTTLEVTRQQRMTASKVKSQVFSIFITAFLG